MHNRMILALALACATPVLAHADEPGLPHGEQNRLCCSHKAEAYGPPPPADDQWDLPEPSAAASDHWLRVPGGRLPLGVVLAVPGLVVVVPDESVPGGRLPLGQPR